MSTKKITLGPAYTGPSIQSKFTKSNIEERLKDYKECKPDKWSKIQVNDRIRYFTNNSFKMGGQVRRNAYPDYLVLANYDKNLSWCVQFADPTLRLFIKPVKKIENEKEEMRKIYEKYKKGQLVPATKK